MVLFCKREFIYTVEIDYNEFKGLANIPRNWKLIFMVGKSFCCNRLKRVLIVNNK